MTHATLIRASIAVAATILAARGHAQTGEPQDPVARERARIEAIANGESLGDVDEELRRYVTQALILGNESDVKKLGAAAAPTLRELCANAALGELATFNPNPIRLLAPLSPEDAVAALRASYASDVARFVFLCTASDGLRSVASSTRLAGRAETTAALAGLIDEALTGDALAASQRGALAVSAVDGGLRSQVIDDAAIEAPGLLESSEGARLFVERERRIHPDATRWTALALLDIDANGFYALTSNPEFHDAIIAYAPWTPALRAQTVAALVTLSISSDATESTRREARETLAGRAEQLRAEDLRLASPERRSALVGVIDSIEPNSSYGVKLVEAALRCAEAAGSEVFKETAIALLDGAPQYRVGVIGRWMEVAERPVESALAVWEVGSRMGERAQSILLQDLSNRLESAAAGDRARLAQTALAVSPDEEDVWVPLLRFAPIAELPADLAVRAVRVLTANGDDHIGELLGAAASWRGVGPGLRAIAGDASEEQRARFVAAAALLRTDEARADDADLVRALLLAVDADDERIPYGALGPFSRGDAIFPTAPAIEARNRAVIDAWNARLDAGERLDFGTLSSAMASAPEAVRADGLALARRVLGGPHADNFFTANGGAVIRLVESAAPGGGDGFELVAAAVATDRATASHFDLALERGFEHAALEGGLRRAESGVLYSGDSNGERYSKPFLSRLVGLPAFRADAANALRLSEALAARGDVELMGFAKEALEEIAALKEVAARIANPTDAAAADAAPDLRATLYEWIEAGQAEGADETTYGVGAIAVRTLAELGDPRDRDFFRGLIESPTYGMDSGAAGVLFRDYLRAWAQR